MWNIWGKPYSFAKVHYIQFSPEHGIQDNNGLYRRHPNISDKMHCVLFVIDAKSLEEEGDYPEFRQIQRILALKSKLRTSVVPFVFVKYQLY